MNSKEQTTSFWEQVLEKAKSTHKCMACDREIKEAQVKAVEAYVRSLLSSSRRVSLQMLRLRTDVKTHQ
jgi:hypothetical protein